MSDAASLRARVLEVVEAAHDQPAAERDAYVEAACAGDVELLAEVRELLAVDDSDFEVLPGNALDFIDRFKSELDRATRHAELRERHSELLAELLERMRTFGAPVERFEFGECLGRGGMGEVFRVRDRVLRREEALKRVRCGSSADDTSDALPQPAAQIRFLQEAQVVAQLDHPNIPTVHEIGVDERGRLFFTMPLVVGESLGDILGELPRFVRAWERPRILEGLLQAARAIAHAHDRGVIHRDLKPANLMLGRYGAMQVVDWGIARVVDDERARDVLYGNGLDLQVESDLSDAAARDEAFETAVGSALGTPSYMSPEQATPDEDVGPATDVYALGAILYQVLTGRPPYSDGPDTVLDDVLARVRREPPTPIGDLERSAPAELVAICQRAMQRDPEQRFPTVQAFVEDLEAYSAGRVVRSYERGVWPEARKWVKRNRGTAVMLVLATAFAVGGGFGYFAMLTKRAADAREIGRLSVIQRAALLERAADALVPPRPDNLHLLEEWRDDALALIAELPRLRKQRAELRTRGARGEGGTFVYAREQDEWLEHELSEAIGDLEALDDREHGPLYGMSERFGHGILRRIEHARAARERTRDPEFVESWRAARAAIEASPRYGGLRMAVDHDLLPLGVNDRGLWEFAHLATGALPPERGESGWLLRPETALVFVLIPGGVPFIGAQRGDPDAPNYAENARESEGSPHPVPLDPYLISKYELTEAQWRRLAGYGMEVRGDLYPMVSISWAEATRALAFAGLRLPTEAQWEAAARGGTETSWWTGARAVELFGRENVAFEKGSEELRQEFIETFGFPFTNAVAQTVDLGAENPFGLVQMLGNVQELCRDSFADYTQPVREGDGERQPAEPSAYRVARGGSYLTAPYHGRCARRGWRSPNQRGSECGARPVRDVHLAE